jgi:antirestriction protein ArdC
LKDVRRVFHPSAAGAFAERQKKMMNTQNPTSEIGSKALATLAAALETGNSAALTAYLSVMARFHKYSWANCLLITMQRPDATRVAGFRAWLSLGRHVRKGEKGIAILAPIVCKVKRESTDQQNEDASTVETVGRVVGFRTAHVFDRLSRDFRESSDGEKLVQTRLCSLVLAADGRRA